MSLQTDKWTDGVLDICEPNFVPLGKTKSLRMPIFLLKYDDKPLFHGLMPENGGTGKVFTFHINHEELHA
jgi:hypothetical protein